MNEIDELLKRSYVDKYISQHYEAQTISKMADVLLVKKDYIVSRLAALHLTALQETKPHNRCRGRPKACFTCTKPDCNYGGGSTEEEAEYLSCAGLAFKPKNKRKERTKQKNDKQ